MSGAVLGDPDVESEGACGPVRVERIPAKHTKPVLRLGPCLQVEGRPQGRQREAALLATRSGQSATSCHFAATCKCHDSVVGSPAMPCVAFALLKTLSTHVTERQHKINADVVGFSLTMCHAELLTCTDTWCGLRTGRWLRHRRLPPRCSMVHVPRACCRNVRVLGPGKPSDGSGVCNVCDTRSLPCTRL
jgi:hypothetical protein